jgi:hypothetical protein
MLKIGIFLAHFSYFKLYRRAVCLSENGATRMHINPIQDVSGAVLILSAPVCPCVRTLQPLNPLPPHGATAPNVPGLPHYRGFTMTLRHTTLGTAPLDEWSARRRDNCWTTGSIFTKLSRNVLPLNATAACVLISWPYNNVAETRSCYMGAPLIVGPKDGVMPVVIDLWKYTQRLLR